MERLYIQSLILCSPKNSGVLAGTVSSAVDWKLDGEHSD